MAYRGIIECGWKTGVHDCRGLTYQHPWLVVYRPTGAVIGCYTKTEAKKVLRHLKSGIPVEVLLTQPQGKA